MNRDELLTKLAMELGEWPDGSRGSLDAAREVYPFASAVNGWPVDTIEFGKLRIHKNDWLQRRAEFINKPSWDDAPQWAQWLAQDKRGEWCFYPERPEQNGTMWINDEPKTGIWVDVHCTGKHPAGHDWRQTLEARPADNTMTPEEEELPAQEKHDCPRCGGCYYSPPHDECPCQPGATTADGILAAARQHMLDRASTYDKPEGERSMNSTVLAFAAITGVLMTEEQGWLFMQLLKAVRSQQGDYRADSYEDGAAYVALAGEAAARDRKFQ